MTQQKPKFAMYWAAACGGCEISVLQIKEKILDVGEAFDIVFWPAATDFKYKDVEALEDGAITLTLFNGAIRNSENEYLAQLLRRKSQVLVAFGACAAQGGIPGLANESDAQEIKDLVYKEQLSVENPEGIYPVERFAVPEGELHLPRLWDTVKALDQVVDVDYYVPGCPPEGHQIWAVLETVIDALQSGAELPPKGSVLGAGVKSCCDECKRVKEEKKISAIKKPWEIAWDPDKCLLEQGVICMGPATRDGCGARCPAVGMPCRGCYGPPPGVVDQGAKMLSTLASIIDAETPEKIAEIAASVPDPLGTFYRFGLAKSLLRRAKAPAAESEALV